LYQFEELFDEALWVFVEKSHPLTRKGATSFVELVDYSWVMQPPTTPSREVLEAAFAAAGAKMPRTRVETTSRFATLQLVKYAGMVGLLPSTILAEYVARGDLVKLDVGTLRPTSRYGLVTRRDEPQNDHVRDFAAIVRSVRRAGESCERS
jgi:DNA-binding transcriptional LysR family regulator